MTSWSTADGPGSLTLRDVCPHDVDSYVRLRCDPVMMAELGGPLPAATIPAKVAADVAAVAADTSWIAMIVPEADRPDVVAGNVVLWSHPTDDDGGGEISEIGWMVLPEFQGRGIARRAVSMLLDRARTDGRWGVVHAFPGVTNGPSNGICHTLGFEFVGPTSVDFAERRLAANHWTIAT